MKYGLKKDGIYNERQFDQLQNEYGKLGMSWPGMPGLNNTFGIAMRKEVADKENIKNISDLASVAKKLTFGAEYDFF